MTSTVYELIGFAGARLAEDLKLIDANSAGRGLAEGFPDYRTYDGEDIRAADHYIEHFGPTRARANAAAVQRVINELNAAIQAADEMRVSSAEDADVQLWTYALRIAVQCWAGSPGWREEWKL